jgi:CRP-like cAMP-binding protein
VLKNGEGADRPQGVPQKGATGGEENRLLAALPQAEYELLATRLARVQFKLKQVLFQAAEQFHCVYFPVQGVVSFLGEPAGKRRVAAYLAGSEGVVGLPLLFGVERSPVRAQVQAPGEAWRLSAEDFRQELARGGPFRDVLWRHAGSIMTRLIQSVVCASSHALDKRCCRWLLMMHDRIRSDEFLLTQGDLAEMIGARRASVTEIAGTLQRAGLIDYKRGKIRIRNRAGLETAACECYRMDRI